MSKRALAVAAVAVAGAVVALVLALSDGDKPPPRRDVAAADPAADPPAPAPAARSGAETATATPAVRARPPTLKPPAMDTTGVGDEPLWTAYDNESRDPSWATEQEGAVRARLRPLLDAANRDNPGAVRVPQVECREVHCRMLVSGAHEGAFMRFVESLQSEDGFYRHAELLGLDGYGKQVDKKTGKEVHEVRVFLQYKR